MQGLAEAGLAGGGEGVDPDFQPDLRVFDGENLPGGFTVLHTPGHMGNHIALVWGDFVFTGDTVMDWASTLISPPDGDLTDFMTSCARLMTLEARIFHAGHGAPIMDPRGRVQWLMDHRDARTAQIRDALATGPMTADALTAAIYTDVPRAMHGAATRNVFAHLVDQVGRGEIRPIGTLSQDATFALT
jgi:glyoxylase-like metal-dependent hydrolase (beta-lactamase superfamily II)